MKKLIEKTISHAMDLGADGCDVIINSGESMSLAAQQGKLDQFKLAKTAILGLRVIKNNKIGLSYSESFDEDAIHFATKSALENAEYSDVNEWESVSVKNPSDFIQKDMNSIDNSSNEEKIEFALRLESEVKKRDSRVQNSPYNGLAISENKSFYMNSLGTYCEEGQSYLSAYTSALIKEGELTSMHYASTRAKKLDQLDLDYCVTEALEHSINWLQAKPVNTGKYDIIFNPNILVSLLNVFSNYYSAKDAIQKTNPWESKINQEVAINNFTLIDSPFYKDAFTHHHVDSEGTFKKDLTLIENGVLKSFYHNTATAKYFKTTTTGHASRGVKNSLNVSGSNWLIKPGTHSASEVTDGTYLEVIDVMGLHSGGDNISGEFSFGASGYLCKDGKRIQPVKEVTVAGNFNKLLLGISRMGNELKHNTHKSFFAPLIRFSDLYVAGK